jgi:hypothetical protein
MSAPGPNPGTHDASSRLERHERWISEFERVYRLGAAKIRGDLRLLRAQAAPQTPPRRGTTLLLVGSRVIVMAGFAAWSIGLADGHAENVEIKAAGAAAANESTCNWSGRYPGAATVVKPGGRAAEPIPIYGDVSEVPVWKTIATGTHDPDSLRKTVRCHTGQRARAVLAAPNFTVSPSKTDIDLAVVSVAALGFGEEGASFSAIHARAAELGLELCPVEVAAQLRLQYLDQPLGEFLHIAMEPVVTEDGKPSNLTVANGGTGPLLVGGHAHADFVMPSAVRFVFVRPR